MNKSRGLFWITVLLIWLVGCKSDILEENIIEDNRNQNPTIEEVTMENISEDYDSDYTLEAHFINSDKSNTVAINDEENYTISLTIYDDDQVIYESQEGELPGKIAEVSILDFDGDQMDDILIVADIGGSGGVYDYHVYAYNGVDVVVSDFEAFSSAHRFNVEIENDFATVSYIESGESEQVIFNEEVKELLEALEVTSPSKYIWGSQIISHYFDHNSQLIIISRCQLMVEHQLVVFADVEVGYVIRNGEWEVMYWDIINR